MRTTLTIEDDVAVQLQRLREQHKVSLKQAVNDLLRAGLAEAERRARPREPYRTPTVSLGRCLVGNVDNVADTLAVAEGEAFR